jgi:hypothetical protein
MQPRAQALGRRGRAGADSAPKERKKLPNRHVRKRQERPRIVLAREGLCRSPSLSPLRGFPTYRAFTQVLRPGATFSRPFAARAKDRRQLMILLTSLRCWSSPPRSNM